MKQKVFLKYRFALLACLLCALAFLPRTSFGLPNVALSNQVDMDFGLIEYSGSGTVNIGTNGNVTYASGFSGDGLGTAGSILVGLTNATLATVACSSSAIVSDGGGNTITVSNIEVVVGSGSRTGFGGGIACGGIGTVIGTFTFTGATNNRTIYFGGQINGTPPSGGSYSSANAGGTSISITVIAI